MLTSIDPLRLIVVEDYTTLRNQLVLHLQTDGHTVHGVDSGIALNELLQTGFVPDILILDLNLPVEDGNSIAERIRQAFPDIGIIMHTVRVSTSDKVQGYCSGADMYVSKPASPLEISAAVASLGRRLHAKPSATWQLDIKNQLLIAPDTQSIALLFTDVLTLHQLAIASQGLLESAQLLGGLKSVYPHWDKSNLEVHVSRLRKKIAPLSGNVSSIKMVRGIGYQLCLSLTIRN
ncbi:MAG: response regulator transcription factor [Methylobacter sp.]|nr:response regulator transcription factor [Methylobacter sp.]MDP2099564.1 response regulator transcription factor [Methylobacter sp.]MDP2428169.1 response regulator transcription factor [Methylobacter sp.]MDP3054163.1 response regulator transcription factor [Methylobacter sp.]MDP3363930.1 response regulator transcription factor [Methylobacter sp.]